MRYFFGRLLHWFCVPGLVQPFEYKDFASGLDVRIKTSPLYTTLTINGRQFFFNRESGKYDGTGAMQLDDAITASHCTACDTQQ